MLTDRQVVELFHLHFLRVLSGRDTRGAIVVKGGCNLRFFFGSARYSEDIDFDVSGTATATLRKQVDGVLASQALVRLLGVAGISIADQSTPKQTDTTQRWKLTLARASARLPTKIEFSRRLERTAGRLESLSSQLLASYQVSAFAALHYGVEDAVAQKIRALADRSEVQARDVFDLGVLVPRAAHISVPAPLLERAISRLLELSYDDYVAQVVAYLEPDVKELHESRTSWEALQNQVLLALEKLRPS